LPAAAALAILSLGTPAASAGTIVTGLGAGGAPLVGVFEGPTATPKSSFLTYDAAFAGGVRVAAADVTGDGVADVVTGAGPGGAAHVKVFDGLTGLEVRSFVAFAGFGGGVYVAAGDVNGDGKADVVVGADAGGLPQVKVFDAVTGSLLRSFVAFDPGFGGGARVGAGDVTGDGVADVVTGAGPGAAAQVKMFDGVTGAEVRSFVASAGFGGGVYVAATGLPPADETGPVLSLPRSITVDATGPEGAVVSFAASANDLVDGPVPVTCRPASGSTFEMGDTTVHCTATDSSGNGAEGSFVVHVRGATEQLTNLGGAVDHVPPGAALANKVRLIAVAVAAGRTRAACSNLAGFIRLVNAQSGKKLTESQAQDLIASAQQIESVLGC